MNDVNTVAPSEPRVLDLQSPDGHRSELAVHGPAAAPIGLLWVPALGVPARKYAPLANALARAGIAVALHEFRGNGTSTWRASRGCDWRYRELLDDLWISRAALVQAQPGTRWVIGGHSLGCQIAAIALALDPGQYAGLAIVAGGQPWWRCFPGWRRIPVLAVFATFRWLSVVFGYLPGESIGFGAREARGVIREWVGTGLSGDYRLASVPHDVEAALARVTHPVFAAHFEQDQYVPPAGLDHLLGKMPRGAQARHEIAASEHERKKADHFTWMRDPGPTVQRLLPWMQSLLQ